LNYAKLHPWLQQALSASPPPSTIRVIVKFVSAVPSTFAKSAGGTLGLDVEPSPPDDSSPPASPPASHPSSVDGPVTFSLLPAVATKATVAQIDAWSRRSDVEIIWLDAEAKPLLDDSVPMVGAPVWWKNGYTGKGIKVAIVDTGIDTSHPDFVGRIVSSWDFTGEGLDDIDGHGTHVAGIVGGSGLASAFRYRGVAPGCLLLVAKVMRKTKDGSTSGFHSWIMSAIEWSILKGVRVINLSLGSPSGDCTDALSHMCEVAVNVSGVSVCVGAGNGGPALLSLYSPGCCPSVITVGATAKDDSVADFSSRGPAQDRRIGKPDFCFPGVDICSTRAHNSTRTLSGYYMVLSGTSMATPHASGACALLLESQPTLTPRQIKDRLASIASDVGESTYAQGAGRVDLAGAYGLRSPLPAWTTPRQPLRPSTPAPAPPVPSTPPRPLPPIPSIPTAPAWPTQPASPPYVLYAGLLLGAGAIIGLFFGVILPLHRQQQPHAGLRERRCAVGLPSRFR